MLTTAACDGWESEASIYQRKNVISKIRWEGVITNLHPCFSFADKHAAPQGMFQRGDVGRQAKCAANRSSSCAKICGLCLTDGLNFSCMY